MQLIFNIIRLMRPYQWIKNAFVFVGIFFANAWSDTAILYDVIFAAISFCLVSSALYIVNDIVDKDRDLHHPKKKDRPVAAGLISVPTAIIISLLLLCIGVAVAWHTSWTMLVILSSYIFLNIAYSFYLKHVILIDVFCISAGFMLRLLAGTVGVGIPPSNWLLLCGLMMTLFLGFTKRRAEIIALKSKKSDHRLVLGHYGPILLDEIIAICATCVIMTYSLYTLSPQTIQTHKTDALIYTVPFVIYAIFRYIYLLHHRQSGGEPSKDLIKDPHTVVAFLGWLITTVVLIYPK